MFTYPFILTGERISFDASFLFYHEPFPNIIYKLSKNNEESIRILVKENFL